MIKRLLTVAFAILFLDGIACADITVDSKHFPDASFIYWIKANVPGADDGILTDEEIQDIKSLNITGGYHNPPASIKGIEFFTELETLTGFNLAEFVQVSEIDVSKNKKLKKLTWTMGAESIYGAPTPITKINVAGLQALDTLSVSGLQCPVDLTDCVSLKYLSIRNGAVTMLNTSGCTSLYSVDCSDNQLSVLDFSDCPNLATINCSNNKISDLCIDGCSQLLTINCNSNILTKLNLKDCTLLKELNCSYNALTELDLDGLKNLSHLDISNNNLKAITLNGNHAFTSFDCSNNSLEYLSISNCDNIAAINCSHNKLSTLHISAIPKLASVDCSFNEFESLAFADTLPLATLNCGGNKFKTLDCSSFDKLTTIDFSWCSNLKEFPKLPSDISSITCSGTPIIAKADLSQYENLTSLVADSCELTEFDASKCPNLTTLHLEGNHMMMLDLVPLTGNVDSMDLSLKQSIYIRSKYLTTTSYSTESWQFTMPLSFDCSRFISCRAYQGTMGNFAFATFETDAEGCKRLVINSTGNPFCYFYNLTDKPYEDVYNKLGIYAMQVDVYRKTEFITGDVNDNGIVNTSDVAALINKILGKALYGIEDADVNGDNVANTSDVTDLIKIILK